MLAAALSGLAQATYLARNSAVEIAPALRFGIGAWPAVAAAVVAHLLFTLAAAERPVHETPATNLHPPESRQRSFTVNQRNGHILNDDLDRSGASTRQYGAPSTPAAPSRSMPAPARTRADRAAAEHQALHDTWPTVSQLEKTAGVSRGTAAASLKTLRGGDSHSSRPATADDRDSGQRPARADRDFR